MEKINVNQKITPFLWFDANAAEAMKFYCSVFKNSRIVKQSHGPDGKLFSGTINLEGLNIHFLNAGPIHATFTESISFFVNCESQEEVDDLWTKLCSNGGKESRCGWLKDQFGLSWQIIPSALGKHLGNPDPEKAAKAMQAMLKMNKIIIADLEAAVQS